MSDDQQPPRIFGPGHTVPPEPPTPPSGFEFVSGTDRLRPKRPNPYRGRGNPSSVYRRKCAELKKSPEGRICVLCGGEIDVTLPPSMANDDGYWTAQHSPSLAEGGDLLKDLIGGAHRICNISEGGRAGRAKQGPVRSGSGQPGAGEQRDESGRPIYTKTETGWTTTSHLQPGDRYYTEYSRPW